MSRIMQGLPWLLLLLIVAKSGISQELIGPDVNPVRRTPSQRLDPAAALPTPPAVSYYEDYILGPGDLLDVRVFQVDELNTTVRVGITGTITLPLLGQLRAEDLTPLELQFKIANRLAEKYVQNPQVTIFIKEFHNQPVSIIGAVGKPGVYQLTARKTLIEMLSLAGGVAQSGIPAGNTVAVTRAGGFSSLQLHEGMELIAKEKVSINLRRLLHGDGEHLNIWIRPRDIISVSKADVIYVIGEVNRPGGFVLADEERVSVLQALAMAHGLGKHPKKGRARIIRRFPDGSRKEFPADLKKILRGKAEDPFLAANDILFIPSSGARSAAAKASEAAIGIASGLLVWRTRF